jgi:hypothetical protein
MSEDEIVDIDWPENAPKPLADGKYYFYSCRSRRFWFRKCVKSGVFTVVKGSSVLFAIQFLILYY